MRECLNFHMNFIFECAYNNYHPDEMDTCGHKNA